MFGNQNMLTAVNSFTKTHFGPDKHPTKDSRNKGFLFASLLVCTLMLYVEDSLGILKLD